MEITVEEIKEAKEELFKISSNEKERMLYEDRSASLLDKVSALENAERKGLQKGLQQGIEKGKKETAKNLLFTKRSVTKSYERIRIKVWM